MKLYELTGDTESIKCELRYLIYDTYHGANKFENILKLKELCSDEE